MADEDRFGAGSRSTLRGVGPGGADTERIDPDAAARGPITGMNLPTGFHDGGSFGRFAILDILGAGGMGVVLAAHDPQLARKVAIKVLRTRGLTPERREREAARLLQEARAMAQLSHANVVTVYEAGTLDERVFIAMEYIAGQTLRSWLAERPRSAGEILDVYGKAGRGLAAAHAANVIHRDFKPDNVLVGGDGRVRVIDFGLARPDSGGPDSVDEETPVGTPVYMAPEQHRRLRVDARADQFAFCVCVYQALYNKLPFSGDTYVELAANVIAGEIRIPAENPNIPPRVVAALIRGLQSNPEDRFPAMEPLLAELEPPPFKRRSPGKTWVTAGLAALSAAAVTLVVVRILAHGNEASAAACEGGAERFSGVWDPGVKERVRVAFAASNRSHAPTTLERVSEELDHFAGDWVVRRKQVCEATRVRHEQSEAAFDARMSCLVDQLDEVRALTALFAGAPDPQLTDKATVAAGKLPQPGSCVDASTASTVPRPATADDRTLVEQLRREAAGVRALADAGKFSAALPQAKALVERAQPLHYAPLEAELQYLLGVAAMGAGQGELAEQSLREAIRLAAIAKDDVLTARAWTQLVQVVGFFLARFDDAIALEPVAEAAIARADGGDAMEADLRNFLANTYLQKSQYDKAKSSYETALALRTRALGTDSPDVAQVHNSLGALLLRTGDLDGATVHLRRALEIREKSLGPDHPDIALPLGNLGAVAQQQKRYDEASAYLERAEKILREVLGPDHPNVALTDSNLGTIARARGDCKKAIEIYERALATFEKLGPTHPYLALPLIGLAHCRTEVGDAQGAIRDGERAIAVLEKQKGDPVDLAEAQYAVGKATIVAGDAAKGRALVAEARAIFEKSPAGKDLLAELDAWVAKHPA